MTWLFRINGGYVWYYAQTRRRAHRIASFARWTFTFTLHPYAIMCALCGLNKIMMVGWISLCEWDYLRADTCTWDEGVVPHIRYVIVLRGSHCRMSVEVKRRTILKLRANWNCWDYVAIYSFHWICIFIVLITAVRYECVLDCGYSLEQFYLIA